VAGDRLRDQCRGNGSSATRRVRLILPSTLENKL
jgi:hypothetical protein